MSEDEEDEEVFVNPASNMSPLSDTLVGASLGYFCSRWLHLRHCHIELSTTVFIGIEGHAEQLRLELGLGLVLRLGLGLGLWVGLINIPFRLTYLLYKQPQPFLFIFLCRYSISIIYRYFTALDNS